MMKSVLKALVLLVLAFSMIALILLFGEVFEFEYPYFLTLQEVRSSKTMAGSDATSIIATNLGVSTDAVDYHRCSYCKCFERSYPKGWIRVEVKLRTKKTYGLAYNPLSRVLRNADESSVTTFPALGANIVSAQKQPNKSVNSDSEQRGGVSQSVEEQDNQ
jgi:hypothetical protein